MTYHVAEHARSAMEDQTGQCREQRGGQAEHRGVEVDQAQHTPSSGWRPRMYLTPSAMEPSPGLAVPVAGGSADIISTVAVLSTKVAASSP